jgi:FKBP-type peptidyl-prolyl cis-trans isomerase FkpA
MKRFFPFLLLCAALSVFSCTKSDTNRCLTEVSVNADSTESANLKAYLAAKGVSATADPRGFYYVVTNPGDTTLRPTVCSSIRVSYTGRLTNNQQFDASNYAVLNLNGLVLGWQEGLPHIGKGGSIILYLPPSLGYGATATTSVPANSVLVFWIDLLDVF